MVLPMVQQRLDESVFHPVRRWAYLCAAMASDDTDNKKALFSKCLADPAKMVGDQSFAGFFKEVALYLEKQLGNYGLNQDSH